MNRSHLLRFGCTLATVVAAVCIATPVARACPFCNAAMQTLSQEIEAADVALIAELVSPMPAGALDSTSDAPAAAKFRVVEALRNEEKLEGKKEIDVIYFGEDAPGKQFLITGLAGVTGPGLDWTTPVPLSEAAAAYVRKLLTIPAQGSERLAFFQEYLENDDPLLAQDAYDEFARTPYADVMALAPKMDRSRLLEWINDSSVGPSSRRLYLTMLGICGQPADIELLEQLMSYDYLAMKPVIATTLAVSAIQGQVSGIGMVDEMLHAEERRKRESLDAMIACYLKLKGPEGLALINKLFLGNPRVEYKHLHSAIMALRFHGEETDEIPRADLLNSMRLALAHRDFADQVIPDLTRWEDWEVMPRLIAMFKDSEKDDWIRQPVVSYLLVAAETPGDVGQQAQAAIAELEATDPETVKRARNLAAFTFLARAAAPVEAVSPNGAGADQSAAVSPEPAASGDEGAGDDAAAVAADSTAPSDSSTPAAAEVLPAEVAVTTEDATSEATSATAVAESSTPATTQDSAGISAPPAPVSPPIATTELTPPSKTKIIGIPLLAAAVLLAVFAVLLRGADPRSSNENP
jgi:hypothetical protein